MKKLLLAGVVVVAAVIALNSDDIKRYLEMRRM